MLEVVTPARTDTRLPGEMEDAVRSPDQLAQRILDEVGSDDVEPDGVLLLQLGVVVVREGVDADDLVALRHERLGEVRADETRRSCHDVPHSREGSR